MKNLFIPHELAVIAKEKGFNEPCLAYFIKDSLHIGLESSAAMLSALTNNQFIQAPLYQQIVDWFRETYCIDFNIVAGFKKYSIKLTGTVESKHLYGTYYEALNKAIEEAFKLI